MASYALAVACLTINISRDCGMEHFVQTGAYDGAYKITNKLVRW